MRACKGALSAGRNRMATQYKCGALILNFTLRATYLNLRLDSGYQMHSSPCPQHVTSSRENSPTASAAQKAIAPPPVCSRCASQNTHGGPTKPSLAGLPRSKGGWFSGSRRQISATHPSFTQNPPAHGQLRAPFVVAQRGNQCALGEAEEQSQTSIAAIGRQGTRETSE